MAEKSLNVFLGGDLVGELVQDSYGNSQFHYHQAWLDSAEPVPLSESLPLRAGLFNRRETRPFFAGLLPEAKSRSVIAKTLGVSEKNDFELLARLGAECAGAVRLLPPSEHAATVEPSYQEISSADLAGKLAILPRRPLLAGENGIQFSLAGAQLKVAIRIVDGMYLLPLAGAATSHILKPQNQSYPGLVENEFFCMQLARAAGLPAAKVEIGTAGEHRFLQIERYDRRLQLDGRLEQVHQEDLCQALGIAPESKYQQDGGPNIKRCFGVLRQASIQPEFDPLRLFDAVVFNALIGNCDAHGKNFSLLREPGSVELAPLYDLVCTQAYPQLDAELAMKLGGERNPEKLAVENWRRFFDESGIDLAEAQQRLRLTARRALAAAEELLDEDCPGATAVIPVIRRHHEQLQALRWK